MAAKKKTVRGSGGSSKSFRGDAAENKILRRQKKLASSGGSKKPSKLARKGTLIKKLDAPVDTGKFLAFVVGDEVRMVPRKPRGKSKRVGCHLRSKPNKAGGSRKMTKAQVAAEFERSFLPYLHDDVAVRTAWNDHVDLLHKQGLVSAVVANSSVPTKFLRRKSNRTGGRRPAKRRAANRSGGWTVKSKSYADPSAAHEFALKLQMKGAKSILINKKGGKHVVSWMEAA